MFQRKRIVQRLFMNLPELETYYKERRKYRFEQGKKLKHIRFREVFYPLFSCFLRLDRLARKQTVAVMGNQRKQKGSVIFACTHIGENDLENIYEALHQGCWWFVGDPCVLYKSISGRRFIINFGREMLPENYGSHTELTQELRDVLATLKWEIWESEGVYSRNSLPEDCRERFLKEFEVRIRPYDTLESVERARFHSTVPSPREAFAYLDKLIPCRENGFLFRRNIGNQNQHYT